VRQLHSLAATLCIAAPALATDGSVKGQKWHDLNANGVKDAGEPVVKDWWIYLDTDRDGVHDSGEPAAKTDAAGNYAITGIKWWVPNHDPRTYDVREKPVGSQPLPLDQCSFPSACKYTLTFTNGQHIYSGKDFGNYERGKIIVKKVNVGGTQTDAFDFSSAKLGDFSLAASQTAGKTFSSLTPGTYGVAELAHAGYTLTGSDCSDGSDPAAIKLSSGETVTCTFTNTRENPVPDTDTATVNVTTPPVEPPTSQPDQQQILPAEIVSGTARMRGPSGCARNTFKTTVSGRRIQRVTFYLNGHRVARINAVRGQKRFVLRINPRGFGFGVHRVRARVEFAADSQTATRTLRLSFQRCARRAGAPQFTG
jgi:hypothetical protein